MAMQTTYFPPSTGIHVLGFDDRPDTDDCVTEAVWINADIEDYQAAKAHFECSLDEGDLIVDWFFKDDMIDNFSIQRQMLSSLTDFLNSRLSRGG